MEAIDQRDRVTATAVAEVILPRRSQSGSNTMNIHERPTEATKAVHSPLEGLRIIDFSTGLAGPFCTMMLADLGADVVQVENTSAGAAKSSNDTMSVALGRNKKAAVLDLGNAEGRAGALALIASADAVVDSFEAGQAEQFGLTAEAMLAVNPALIHCSLSTFGKTGPLGGSSASDLVLQALTGGMDITGEPGRPPVKMGLPLGEEISGLVAAIAVSRRPNSASVPARAASSTSPPSMPISRCSAT